MAERLKKILDGLSLPRRAMLPAALLGASSVGALLSSEAKADTAFTSFAFTTLHGSTQRTTPVRLEDVVNVLDFGADPNNNTTSGVPTATTNAINAAIAFAATKGSATGGTKQGGTVFFPPGNYAINGSLTNSGTATVRLVGSGMWCTWIRGAVNGYIIDMQGSLSVGAFTSVEDLGVYNDQTSSGFDISIGAIRVGSIASAQNVLLKNIQFKGWTGINTVVPTAENSTTFETTLINCSSSGAGSGAPWSVIPTIPYVAGPIGFYVAGCTMICCAALGYAVAYWFAGADIVALRGRTESSAIGVLTGITPRFDDTVAGASATGSGPYTVTITSTTPLANFDWSPNGQTQQITVQGVSSTGPGTFNTTQVTALRTGTNTFTYSLGSNPGSYVSGGTWTKLAANVSAAANVIMGHSTERCETGMFFSHFDAGTVDGLVVNGNVVGPAHTVTGMTVSGTGPYTVEVTSATPLANFGINGIPWTSGITQQVIIDSAIPSSFNSLTPVTATWTGANKFTYSLNSPPGSYVSSANWSFQMVYGMRVRNTGMTTLKSCNISCNPSIAGIDLYVDGLTSAARPMMIASTAGVGGWIMPPGANKANWTFINCDNPGGSTLDVAGRQAGMNFADLPGLAGNSLGVGTEVEGMEYNIVNARKTGAVPLTGSDLGATVITGGTQHAKVRYNGTNWTCAGF
jgi:hypothetical protein